MDNEYIIKEIDKEELLRVLSHYCTLFNGKMVTINLKFVNKGKDIYEIIFYYLDASLSLEIEVIDIRKILILYAKELGFELEDYRFIQGVDDNSIPYFAGITLYLKEFTKKKVKNL